LLDIEISLPPSVDCGKIARVIDDAIAQIDLSITLRDSLKKFPDCIHWHAKNGRESGTLEITLWPREHRAWFTIYSGRAAPWIDAKMKLLEEFLHRRLGDT
jgi:hypothetical protein